MRSRFEKSYSYSVSYSYSNLKSPTISEPGTGYGFCENPAKPSVQGENPMQTLPGLGNGKLNVPCVGLFLLFCYLSRAEKLLF